MRSPSRRTCRKGALTDCINVITDRAAGRVIIDNDMTDGLEKSQRERAIGRSALRRLARLEDVAEMTAFLMGESGPNITGAVMTVDAGATA